MSRRRTRKLRWLIGALAAAAVLAPAAMAASNVALPDGLAIPHATAAVSERSVQFNRAPESGVALGQVADGLRYQALADAYRHGEKIATLRGLRAEGLRYQGIAQTYQASRTTASAGSGFDWGSAGIGAGVAAFFAAISVLGALTLVGRRRVLQA